MPCYAPRTAYKTENGISFNELSRDNHIGTIQLRCKQCIGCRLDTAREWTLRILHEAQMHKENQFITLTYDDEHLPPTLTHAHFSGFMKRYRRRLQPKRISYYMCGEYGDQTKRPHFHAIIFGHYLQDSRQWRQKDDGTWIYSSKTLDELWGMGQTTTGEVNPTTANYVAGYIIQKQNQEHYAYIQDGILHPGVQPYNCMSTNPAIGKRWYDKHAADIETFDYAIDHKGAKQTVPAYYDKLRERTRGDLSDVKAQRELTALQHWANNTDARLAVRHEVHKARIRNLKREN